MKQETYDEIAFKKLWLEREYQQLRDRLQAIINYRNLKVPGNVRLAALRRAKEMQQFAEELIRDLS